MGFSISWLVVHGLPRADILARLNAVDTGRVQDIPEAHLSAAELPHGWVVLYSTDFDFAVSEPVHPLFEAGVPIVGCQVHEGIMVSIAFGGEPGSDGWSLVHDGNADVRDLTVKGAPPPAFAAIRDRLAAEQDAEGEDPGVDLDFDIPVETAFAVNGFRHDRWRFDWGQPAWTVAELR